MWQSLVSHKAVLFVEWVCEAYLSLCPAKLCAISPQLESIQILWRCFERGPVPVHVTGVAQLMGYTLKLGP